MPGGFNRQQEGQCSWSGVNKEEIIGNRYVWGGGGTHLCPCRRVIRSGPVCCHDNFSFWRETGALQELGTGGVTEGDSCCRIFLQLSHWKLTGWGWGGRSGVGVGEFCRGEQRQQEGGQSGSNTSYTAVVVIRWWNLDSGGKMQSGRGKRRV